jgi:chromosome segregation ATPase
MSETTGAKSPEEELEAEVFRALDRYFESRLREVEASKERIGGAGFRAYEEARRQLAQAEQELEQIQYRTAELKAHALDTVVESSAISDLEEGVSELQDELGALANAEQSALERKREAEERLQRTKQDYGENVAEATNDLAAAALAEVEEIDAFKGRVDQRFAEGRSSVLELAT